MDTIWIDDLKRIRAELFHQRAVWISVQITSIEPIKMALILLRHNVKYITAEADYFKFSTLTMIFDRFLKAMPQLQSYAIGLLELG